MSTTYAPRPSEDPGPPQWTAADLRIATARRDFAAIETARAAGQLADLLTNGDPTTPHGADHVPGLRNMSPEQARAILAAQPTTNGDRA